jgi:hypothetical protein
MNPMAGGLDGFMVNNQMGMAEKSIQMGMSPDMAMN